MRRRSLQNSFEGSMQFLFMVAQEVKGRSRNGRLVHFLHPGDRIEERRKDRLRAFVVLGQSPHDFHLTL